MSENRINFKNKIWEGYEKVLFRFAFIYLFLQVFPLDWKYYRHLFNINWLDLSFAEIFQISKYTPQFLSWTYNPRDWGMATFADWILILLISIVGTAIWSFTDKKSSEYSRLYAYLRILVRYRLAIAVISYGFLKLYGIQAPYPSVSNMNTLYGDFTTWKVFSLSLGIVPGYQTFLGAVELLAGVLLLFRRTSVIGATIIIFFTGNVFMSNLAYEGGEVVYSFYLVVLALFLVIFDGHRIIKLIVLHVPVAPAQKVILWTKEFRIVRLVLKSLVVFVFVIFYGFSSRYASRNGAYLFNPDPGLKGVSGLFDVVSFKLNGELRPYSVTDSLRWQDVVFENWATLSIRINKKQSLINDNVERVPLREESRLYEFSGTNGRVYYNYKIDSTQNKLLIRDLSRLNYPHVVKNSGVDHLEYNLGPDSTLVLTGEIAGNRVEAILQKNPKKYLLKAAEKGRLRKLKL